MELSKLIQELTKIQIEHPELDVKFFFEGVTAEIDLVNVVFNEEAGHEIIVLTNKEEWN